MHTRRLGKSGWEVSEIGLGCWQLGGDFGPLGRELAGAILAEADRSGISFWDTADVYGAGESERHIANYLRAKHPRVRVATKVGRDPALYPAGYTRAGLRRSIEGSLSRLGVETLDLVQLHCVPPDVLKSGELLEWLADLQEEGLIRAFGASVETLDEGRFAASHPKLASLQIIFNLFRQDAIDELFPLAARNDVGIIVRLPLASGVLAGGMQRGQVFAPGDHRQFNRHGEAFSQGETFSGVPFEHAVEFVEEIKHWAPAGMSMAQLAMRWILDQPAVSTVIAGASRPGQVRENATVSALSPLPPDVHERLGVFYRETVRPAVVVPI
jgi:aryl-alcohol dehydrogenase-like predicted oxidoreductase